MATSTSTHTQSEDRIARVVAIAGVLLVTAGAAASLAHLPGAGETLRWIGIACFIVFAVRKPSLMTWTFLAMVAGIELGIDAPHMAAQVRLPGDLFLRLIRMIVAPLLFATITTGIAGHNELRSVGRVAIKALILFEVVTTLGLIIGVVAMNISGAGWGIAIPAVLEGAAPAAAQAPQTWQQIILNLFPNNIAEAVAQNQILQVAIFSILFGSALAMLPDQKRAPLVSVLQSLADVMFQMTRFIMYLAPLAAGAAIAYTVGNTGLATLLPLAKLVVTYYIALTAFALLVMVPVMAAFRVPLAQIHQGSGRARGDWICNDDFGGCSSVGDGAHGRVRRAALDRFLCYPNGLQLQHDRRQRVSLDGGGFRCAGGGHSSHVWTGTRGGPGVDGGEQGDRRSAACVIRGAAGNGERSAFADRADSADSWCRHADGHGPDHDERGRQLHGGRGDRQDGRRAS